MSGRLTRSQKNGSNIRSKAHTQQLQEDAEISSASTLTITTTLPTPTSSSLPLSVRILPPTLASDLTGLSKRDQALLDAKQRWLRTFAIQIPGRRAALKHAVDATLVFAQEEAGTAVCISPRGLLLTCSHCIAESVEELQEAESKWLVFAYGQVVQARCIDWDPQRDLALLRIVAAQTMPDATGSSHQSFPPFPFISPANHAPRPLAKLACIGHPGSEDLEASAPSLKTNYDILHVSTGTYRGCAPGQDPQDNSEIGALMHDCWTYWGHSGAPLVEQETGRLVGLHSSWDESTGMRRGVPLAAVMQFLQRNSAVVGAL